jgi:hypothetical protein
MRLVGAVLALLAASVSLASCQAPRQTFDRVAYGDPAKAYLGMTKEQILACAGKPYNSYATGKGETLTFHYSGAGPVPTADAKQKQDQGGSPLSKPKSDKNWKCSASLAFEDGRLARVNFATNQVVGPYDTKKDSKTGEKVPVPQPEPCTFSLPNCRAQ